MISLNLGFTLLLNHFSSSPACQLPFIANHFYFRLVIHTSPILLYIYLIFYRSDGIKLVVSVFDRVFIIFEEFIQLILTRWVLSLPIFQIHMVEFFDIHIAHSNLGIELSLIALGGQIKTFAHMGRCLEVQRIQPRVNVVAHFAFAWFLTFLGVEGDSLVVLTFFWRCSLVMSERAIYAGEHISMATCRQRCRMQLWNKVLSLTLCKVIPIFIDHRRLWLYMLLVWINWLSCQIN